MPTELELLRQHAAVLFDVDEMGRLVRLNEPGDEPPPRLFLARGRLTQETWFRSDVDDATVNRCRSIANDLPPWDGKRSDASLFEPLRVAVAKETPVAAESIGPSYRFGGRVGLALDGEATLIDERSAHLLDRHFPYTRTVLSMRRPVAGVILDGWVVSACFSARARPTASEAGVATEESYRGRGLASLVVSTWRDAVERDGKQPLYSTSWDNPASLGVARKLLLVAYAETISLA
jgi:GNAT superfamily N-acetyltransferase